MERAGRRRGLSAPQPGRRERKKLAARSAILDASARLFVKKGFEGTRVEAIAQDADVGVGTVYNYFATKADILVAILFGDVADVVAGTRSIVERGGPDAATVVAAAVGVLLDVMERRPRNLWRDLIGHALLDGGSLGLAYRSAETVLLGVVRTGFERLRANGRIDPALPAEESTEIAFSLAKTGIYRYAFNDHVTPAEIVKDLERQLRVVAPPPLLNA